ncbi:zf-MYND-domain-containing protein [Peniophora sp. CONT]|nr:zf-MYND-domain-containing protein [Peniophora sp. CONT]
MSDIAYCTYCGKQATPLCSKCKTARYCSAEHQRADWNAHKLYCGKAVKGILIPADSQTPRLVTVATTELDDRPNILAGLYMDGVSAFRPYLGAGGHERLVCKNAGGPEAPYVDRWLQVWCVRLDTFTLVSAENICPYGCAHAFVGDQLKHDWRGNLLVLKSKLRHSDRPYFVDGQEPTDVVRRGDDHTRGH